MSEVDQLLNDMSQDEGSVDSLLSEMGGSQAEEVNPQKNLADEYSTSERALIGAGRSFAKIGQGVKQLGLNVGESLGVVDESTVEDYRQQIKDEKRLYDEGVGSTTAGQVGEFAGDVAALAPAMLVPGGQATLLGRAGVAAGVGAAEASLQPVYTENYGIGKAEQVAMGATIGAGATIGFDKLANIMPKNLMARFYQRAEKKGAEALSEADILEEITGIRMTPAEKAQSKSLQTIENIARQSIITADDLAAYDKKVARQGMAAVTKLMRQISRPAKGAESVGIELQKAAKDAADSAILNRKVMANRDYGEAVDLSGGSKIIERKAYINELNNIINDFSGSDMEDAVSVVKQAKDKLSRAVKETPEKKGSIVDASGNALTTTPASSSVVMQTVRDAINDRSFLGNAAKGTGNIFKDIDKNLNRQIANRLHKAMTKDLVEAEGLGSIGEALKKANTNYAKNSSTIKAIEASPLGRILGKEFDDAVNAIDAGTFNSIPGEKAVKKIMSLEPSEIRQVMKAIDKQNPQTADSLRSFVIKDALDKAFLPPSAGMNKGSMSFNKFQTNLEKNKIGAYGLSSKDAAQIKDIVSAMQRIGDRSGYNFSETQVVSNVMDIKDKLAALATGGLVKGSALALEVIGLRRIAKAMTTEEGRQALRVITKAHQQGSKFDKAIYTIQRLTSASLAQQSGSNE